MDEKTARAVAAKIANDLFTNGKGDVAQRLVLELSGGHDGGGWSRAVVVDRITDVLVAQLTPEPDED